MTILFASCFRSDSSNNNLEYESQAADSFAADTIYSEITEDFTNDDTVNASSTELNEDNNEWKADFQYLIPLKEYLIKLKDDGTLLLYYPNLEPVHIESKSTQKRVDMRNNTHSFSVNSFYLIVF